MTLAGAADLERGYRRWLRWYPGSYRREHGDEILAVLLAGAGEGRRRPDPVECLGLVRGGLRMRLRPSVPSSDRSTRRALGLMCLGAALELAAAISLLATVDDVRSAVASANPGLTGGEWHAVVAGHIEHVALAACAAAGVWLWLAWAVGRGRRWAGTAFVALFCVNTYGLVDGLARGSAAYARADLAIAILLWLVQLATVATLLAARARRRPLARP